ncbi:MAG: type II toxin-antitoxin system VapC family toxin [Candidatus Verstraetearchaeota archaeon]|nr:type II toxin-antitoxin system VapC family toxin [Candidatus Verstraetearchaeota archaeon]
MIVFDSYAWIEYLLGSPSGKVANGYLDGEEALTPSIVLAEVSRKYLREGVSDSEIAKRLNFIATRSTVVELDPDLSLLAGKAYMELSQRVKSVSKTGGTGTPSLTDGIVLATGRALGAKILTGDVHFKGLPEVIYLG